MIRFPVRGPDGRITHIGGFDVDITARKAMEEALKTSEQRFRAFAEAHPVPLFIAHLDTAKVIFASPPCAEVFRVPLGELLAGTTLRLYADPDDRPKVMDRLRREGVLDGVEVRLRRADGSEFWAAFTSRLITFEGQNAVVTALVDLTERKRVEAELARQRQILHQNEKMSALGSLLAGVAHELNNPLSVVVGHASLLEDFAPDGAIRERALKIRTAADRCARIVRTFLAMARSKPRQRTAVQLNDTIGEALEIVAYGLRTADVEVVRVLAPDLPPVWADGDQLHQVFANLFVNAQQALQSVPPPRRLTVTSGFDAGSVWVEVADNGPGVPADIAHRIFEPFFTTKPQGIGTGVGLSVCHGIVAAHDGEIRLEPRPQDGRHFRRSAAAHGGGGGGAARRRAGPPLAPRAYPGGRRRAGRGPAADRHPGTRRAPRRSREQRPRCADPAPLRRGGSDPVRPAHARPGWPRAVPGADGAAAGTAVAHRVHDRRHLGRGHERLPHRHRRKGARETAGPCRRAGEGPDLSRQPRQRGARHFALIGGAGARFCAPRKARTLRRRS